MTIVHLIFALNTGGIETMLVDIVNEQVKTDNITLIILNNSITVTILKKIDKKVKIVKVNREPGSKSIYSVIKLNWLLYKISPDFVHCHNHEFAKIIFKSLLNIKIGLTIHAINIPATFENYHNKYDIFFAISNAVKEAIVKRATIKPIVVANGIHFNKIKKREQYNFKKFNIVQIGRLYIDEKGQDIAIKALDIIINREKRVDVFLDFIGDGSSYDYLKKLVIKYKLTSHIKFFTNKDREYVYDKIHNYNLLIQPSRLEGFGLTIVEAMAAKIPVLVSDIGGPKEIVENGQFGALFESENSEDCSNQILNIIKEFSKEDIKEKMNHIHTIMRKRYDIQATAKKYLNLYKSFI